MKYQYFFLQILLCQSDLQVNILCVNHLILMYIYAHLCVNGNTAKGDKPRQFIKNWHPISLLSVMYKIGSSAIANRIKKFLGHVISPEQSGFISGWYISDSSRLIYDLMSIAEQKYIPGNLMLVDFEKSL